jgi:hypothetical protein
MNIDLKEKEIVSDCRYEEEYIELRGEEMNVDRFRECRDSNEIVDMLLV